MDWGWRIRSLTSWTGQHVSKADVSIAKNYLNAEELDALNRIVTIYLDFAELQALNRRPMYMKDWLGKLDDFLHLSEREILHHSGSISHETALALAREEYAKFHATILEQPTPAEEHFRKAIRETKRLEKKQGTRLEGHKENNINEG